MASPTQWTRVWVDSGNWWWTGRPGMLWFMGSQRVRHHWAIELNWTELNRTEHRLCFWLPVQILGDFPGGTSGGDSRDAGLIPGSGRSPGGGNGNPLQHSCLENSMDRGTWWTTVHGVAKSQTWLSTHTYMIYSILLYSLHMCMSH